MILGDPNSPQKGAGSHQLSRGTFPAERLAVIYGGLGIAIILHVLIAHYSLYRTMDADPFSWASTNEMTSARSYAETGIVTLHGLQITNNPPLGKRPDAYTHWPPLFPMILSRFFLVFGESDAVARVMALACSSLLILAFYFLARTCLENKTAVCSVFALLTLPAFSVFARLVLGVNLSLAFMIVALAAFIISSQDGTMDTRWAWVGGGAFAMAVLVRWEPLFLAPSLVIVALLQKNRQRLKLALLYSAIGAITVFTVLAIYMAAAPWLRGDLWETILYRTGLRPYGERAAGLHQLATQLYYARHPMPGFREWMGEFASRTFNGLGTFGLLAVFTAMLLAYRYRRRQEGNALFVILGGLLGTWIFWYLLMSNQVFDNGFEIMWAAPGAALCLGMGVEFLSFDLLVTRLAPWAVSLALLIPLAQYTIDVASLPKLTDGVEYSHEINAFTEMDSVVFTPFDGMETVYYSRRHVIRSISDDNAVESALQRVDAALPGATVYIALHPALLASFAASLRAFPVIKQTKHLVLIRVTVAGNGAGSAAASTLQTFLPGSKGP
jgi:hypothetical protein